MEDIKVREMQIFDYKKNIAESETKLKQQQNLYEAVRSDRNLYSKNLIEAQVLKCSLFLGLFLILIASQLTFSFNIWNGNTVKSFQCFPFFCAKCKKLFKNNINKGCKSE